MNKAIHLVVGCPGSGKTWVCLQLQDKFHHIPHDDYIDKEKPDLYLKTILHQSTYATKPILIEAPFSVTQIRDPLRKEGFEVTPYFIIETPRTVMDRYRIARRKPIPTGHLSRMDTYRNRAIAEGHFYGTSEEVLHKLRGL